MAQSEGGTGAWRGPRLEETNPRTSRTRRRRWTSSWGAWAAKVSAQESGMTGSEHQGWELGGLGAGPSTGAAAGSQAEPGRRRPPGAQGRPTPSLQVQIW